MSSQTSIRGDVNNRPHSFRANALASAPAPQSIDSVSANSATKEVRRPILRSGRKNKIFEIAASESTQPTVTTPKRSFAELRTILGRESTRSTRGSRLRKLKPWHSATTGEMGGAGGETALGIEHGRDSLEIP
jgi:hypothetical protein